MIQTFPGATTPKGCFNVTLTGAAQTVAALIGVALPAGTKHLLVVIESSAAGGRWRDDAVDPTTSTGILLPASGVLEIKNDESRIAVMKFCRDGGVNVAASVWLAS